MEALALGAVDVNCHELPARTVNLRVQVLGENGVLVVLGREIQCNETFHRCLPHVHGLVV